MLVVTADISLILETSSRRNQEPEQQPPVTMTPCEGYRRSLSQRSQVSEEQPPVTIMTPYRGYRKTLLQRNRAPGKEPSVIIVPERGPVNVRIQ